MSEAEVIAQMCSAPTWTNNQFTLMQYTQNEKEYAKTNGVDAKTFYTWVVGDWCYCAGFDANGLLVMKGDGGT